MEKISKEKKILFPSWKIFLTTALLYISTSFPVFSQTNTVFVPSDIPPNEGNLNSAVQAAIDNGTLSNTIFNLESNGYYILTEKITVPSGEHLTIVADQPGQIQATSPPQIMWSSSTSKSTDVIFECLGELTLKNIWLRYANVNGEQVGSEILIVDNLNPDIQEKATFEGVIFDYDPIPLLNTGGAVTVTADHFVGTFKNCYFKNCIDSHFRYYGRAVSFPYQSQGLHTDSLSFENCTFANMGYVFSQEPNNYSDFVWFNHCTFLNSAMFAVQSGFWNWLSVTNSIFVNTYMYGVRPIASDTETHGGTIKIEAVNDFGFNVPFTENDRRILFTNSSYYIEDWLTDWMQNNPYSQGLISQGNPESVPGPQPMMNSTTIGFLNSSGYPYMNSSNLYDGTNPGFILPPTNIDSIKAWLLIRWDTNSGNVNWAYKPEEGLNGQWPLTENLSYTNEVLKKAGMENFPLGDLYHWWPDKYQQWKAQEEYENLNILNMLTDFNNPAVPKLLSPQENSVNQPADSLTFKWNSAPIASGYEFQLSLHPSFVSLVTEGSTSDTTLTVTSLEYYTKYYWRVRTYNGALSSFFSPIDSFKTMYEILTIPELISPASNAVNVSPVVKLICNKTPDAEQYYWQVSQNIDFNASVITGSRSDSTFTVGPLEAGKKYYWRVRGVTPTGFSDFTSPDSFTVIPLPLPTELISPQENSENLPVDSVMFKWNSASFASGYEFQLSTDQLFTTLAVRDSISDTTFTVNSLKYNTNYYWRVRSYNAAGFSLFSSVGSFKTIHETLTIPELLSPQSNAINLPPFVELICNKTPDASQYYWQVTSKIDFTNFVADDSTSDSTITVGPLAAGTKYFWRVQAVSPAGFSDFTSPDSFTVISLPLSPELVSPVSTTDEELIITFVWHQSILAAEYHLQVSLDSLFSSTAAIDTLVADTTVVLSDSLNSDSKYFWRVSGKNSAGEGPYSSVAHFNTKTTVVDVKDENLPKEFALYQNYPNPFNPTTTIKYSVPKGGFVSLKVYNLLGEEVANLFEGFRQAGSYKTNFDGSKLTSGVYIYQFKANNFIDSKKLVLLK